MNSNFIPQLWSARLLAHLDNALVARRFFNTDWEGEISDYGDRIKINQISDVEVFEYIKNQDMTAPELVDGDDVDLLIDFARAFHFYKVFQLNMPDKWCEFSLSETVIVKCGRCNDKFFRFQEIFGVTVKRDITVSCGIFVNRFFKNHALLFGIFPIPRLTFGVVILHRKILENLLACCCVPVVENPHTAPPK